jgi:hypothetical protein
MEESGDSFTYVLFALHLHPRETLMSSIVETVTRTYVHLLYVQRISCVREIYNMSTFPSQNFRCRKFWLAVCGVVGCVVQCVSRCVCLCVVIVAIDSSAAALSAAAPSATRSLSHPRSQRRFQIIKESSCITV